MRSARVAVSSLLLTALAGAGCGDKGGGGAGPGSGDAGVLDLALDVEVDLGSDVAVVITSVPADWSRPADCHGVGELCDGLGCGDGGMCQLLGSVCTPLVDINNPPGFSVDTPYCLAYVCMTYDQASCFCTGPAAAQYPLCNSGPAGVAGLCVGEGSACDETACCNGLGCIALSPTNKACYRRCAAGGDCDTGCCTDWRDTGDQLCAAQTACAAPCTKRGQTCASNADCCNGVCVMDANPDWNGCRPGCTTNADCDTGCCTLFANSTTGFCTDAGYCGCGAACAAGSSCTTFDNRTYACRPDCTDAADCASQCCSGDIPGADHGVCLTTECGCPGGCMPGEACLSDDGGATYACVKKCTQASDCSSMCCSQPIPDKTYGTCLLPAACGL
ncbi:MAG TPA: hypothetical protein VIF57_08180 [Polyangia bacterium]|jgi:hypothetical protein